MFQDRQWELIRMADAAIEIYSAAAVLSRCNHAANQQSSFEYEQKLTELYTLRVSCTLHKRVCSKFSDLELTINWLTCHT